MRSDSHFHTQICRSCRNCGLTRANVALNESVHRLFFLHISDTILYGGLLAVCKDKRQSVIKAVHILRFQHKAAFSRLRLFISCIPSCKTRSSSKTRRFSQARRCAYLWKCIFSKAYSREQKLYLCIMLFGSGS